MELATGFPYLANGFSLLAHLASDRSGQFYRILFQFISVGANKAVRCKTNSFLGGFPSKVSK